MKIQISGIPCEVLYFTDGVNHYKTLDEALSSSDNILGITGVVSLTLEQLSSPLVEIKNEVESIETVTFDRNAALKIVDNATKSEKTLKEYYFINKHKEIVLDIYKGDVLVNTVTYPKNTFLSVGYSDKGYFTEFSEKDTSETEKVDYELNSIFDKPSDLDPFKVLEGYAVGGILTVNEKTYTFENYSDYSALNSRSRKEVLVVCDLDKLLILTKV